MVAIRDFFIISNFCKVNTAFIADNRLTYNSKMSDACHFSRRVTCCTFICSFILWEYSGNVERMVSIVGAELEVLGWFDRLVVVVPLNYRFWYTNNLTAEL